MFDGLGDGDFQITYANQQAGAIFGYAADQLGGLDYLTLVHPNDRERIAARKRLASLGAPVGVETYRALRSDGEVIWLTTRSRVFAHGPSCPRQTCVATSVRDVTEGREQEVALIEARSRIDHILNIVPGVFYHVVYGKDDGDRQAFVSENVADWFGVSHEEASRPGFLEDRALIDLTAARLAALERSGECGIASLTYAARFHNKVIWLHDTLRCLRRADGGREVVGFVSDATAEHFVELEMCRMNWALAAYSRSLSVMLRAGPLDELMTRVCESIVEQPVYVLACYALPDPGQGLPVRYVAKAGSAADFLGEINVSWAADDPNGQGRTGQAMREGVPHIVQDTWTDPKFALWRERSNRFGIRSVLNVPSSRDGKVVGALIVYASAPNVFGPAELALFQRLSDEIAFAISLEQDRERLREADAGRRQTEEHLNAVVQLGPGLLYRAQVRPEHVDILGVFGDKPRIAQAIVGSGDGNDVIAQILGQPGRIAALLALPDSSTHSEDYVSTAVDGSACWLRNAMRITARGGDAVEVVGYISEVTQEKEQQLQRQQVATLLTLGEMATGMAHELCQPLFSILLSAENAAVRLDQQTVDLEQVALKVEKIIRETKRASRLIDHMRIFARNERERMQPVSLRAVLTSAMEILQGKVKGIQVVDAIPSDLPFVMGRPIPLEQILINLIGNAADAYQQAAQMVATRGGTSVEKVVIVSGSVEGDQVVLRVKDLAGGIPPQVLARVFEPFFTTKPVGKGTGLGLAIAADAARDMGGVISVANDGEGAVFEVCLPIGH